MIHPEIERLINEQITHEQYAAQLYLSMSAWFYGRDLDGIGHYFRVQSKEELMHAEKFFDYLNDLGGTIKLGAVDAPPHDFADEKTIFALAFDVVSCEVVVYFYSLGDFSVRDFFLMNIDFGRVYNCALANKGAFLCLSLAFRFFHFEFFARRFFHCFFSPIPFA